MPKHLPPNEARRTVAYMNDDFLNSPDARALRILAEYLEPLAHFRRERVRDTVVFFGSARIKEDGPLSAVLQGPRANWLSCSPNGRRNSHRALTVS